MTHPMSHFILYSKGWYQLRRQGFMYNGSAENIVDKWIELGSNGFPKDGVVWEAIRLAKLNHVWDRKHKK